MQACLKMMDFMKSEEKWSCVASIRRANMV